MDFYGITFYVTAITTFLVEGWLIWDVSHWLAKDLTNPNKEEF